jgi:hypothetical protein
MLLYSCVREQAFTSRNIKSGWSKIGLYPFSPYRVLKDIQKLVAELRVPNNIDAMIDTEALRTLVTLEALTALYSQIDCDTPLLDAPNRYRLRKLANAASKCFAKRALLLDENRLLFKQNNESNCCKLVRSTKVGEAKVISYDDIVDAQAKCNAKEATV